MNFTPEELDKLEVRFAAEKPYFAAPLVVTFQKLIEDLRATRRSLAGIQYGSSDQGPSRFCPECDGLNPDLVFHEDEPEGHNPGCSVAAALGAS